MIVLFVLLFYLVSSYKEDTCDNFTNILTRHGYSYEVHTVTTTDGYILTLFRIVGVIGVSTNNEKPVIVMQHGVAASANSFVGNGKSSIAFYFVNRGYDVWVANGRGTQYSKQHVKLSPKSKEFWDFSFEELGIFDTRAYLEYICNVTRQKVNYFGFSQGFMQLLAAFSFDPEFFQQRLKKIVGWGAVVRVDLSGGITVVLASYINAWAILPYTGITHIGEYDEKSCLFEARLFDSIPALRKLSSIFNGDFLPYLHNVKSSFGRDFIGIKDGQHLLYNAAKGGFYRHPSHGNKVEYNMSNIKGVPIGIGVGKVDLLASEKNAEWLQSKLGQANLKILGYYKDLGHLGFLINYHTFQHFTDAYNFLNE